MLFIVKLLDKPDTFFDLDYLNNSEFPHWYIVNDSGRRRVRNKFLIEILNQLKIENEDQKMVFITSLDLIFQLLV